MKIRIFWNLIGLSVGNKGQISSPTFPLRLYSDRGEIERLFKKRFKYSVGEYDLDTLRDGVIFYYELEWPPHLLHQVTPGLIGFSLDQVRNRITALWLLKDNAVDVSTMFIEFINGSTSEVHKMNANKMMVNCQGKREDITVGVEQLSEAFALYERRVEPSFRLPKSSLLGVSYSELAGNNFQRAISQEGIGRFARFWEFVMLARSTGDLGVKMAHNCIALEAFFGSSSEGVTEQISERVACFLSDRNRTRKDITFHIKDAYDIRSRVVHGSPLCSDRISALAKMCDRMDQYLRDIAKKYLEDPNLQEIYADEDRLNAYFESLHLN